MGWLSSFLVMRERETERERSCCVNGFGGRRGLCCDPRPTVVGMGDAIRRCGSSVYAPAEWVVATTYGLDRRRAPPVAA
jgi:hypothetical protein